MIVVPWRAVAGCVLSGRVFSGRVRSLGSARSVLSIVLVVVAEGTVGEPGSGVGVLEEYTPK